MKANNYLFAGIAALVLATGTFAAQQQAKQKPVGQKPENPTFGAQTREEKRKLHEVRVNRGLKEAARLYGGYIEHIEFDEDLAASNLSVLAGGSDLIARGLVKRNRSVLVRSRVGGFVEPVESIATDYTVQLLDVYKGDLRLLGREITVRIPGGRFEFDGGLYAEIRTSGFVPPMNQDEFIMFLQQNQAKKTYGVFMGRQGLFEVKPGGWVSPRARAGSPIAKKAKRDFLDFVRQLNEAIVEADRAAKKNR